MCTSCEQCLISALNNEHVEHSSVIPRIVLKNSKMTVVFSIILRYSDIDVPNIKLEPSHLVIGASIDAGPRLAVKGLRRLNLQVLKLTTR